MSKKDEALKLALESHALALEYWRHRQQRYKNRAPVWVEQARAAMDAIREALAEQPAQQEPVAFCVRCDDCDGTGLDRQDNNYHCSVCDGAGFVQKMLYTSPPPIKPWVGLIDKEIDDAFGVAFYSDQELAIYHAIEAKLKEKNT